MVAARGFCVAVATIVWSLAAGDLPERFRRELFPNDMAPLRRAEADILGALYDFDETAECRFDGVIRGGFTSAGSSEVVVSAHCGEPHADNYGSTVLLTFRSGVWEVAWRQAGLITRHCARIRFNDGRDGLLCKDHYTHMGCREQYLYSIDFSKSPKERQAFLVSAVDTMLTGRERCTETNIERVELKPPYLKAWVRHGTTSLPKDIREQNLVGDEEPAAIPTRVYRLDYRLSDNRFDPTPATVELLGIVSPNLKPYSTSK